MHHVKPSFISGQNTLRELSMCFKMFFFINFIFHLFSFVMLWPTLTYLQMVSYVRNYPVS